MRQSAERVWGPYHESDRSRWRVVIGRADGARKALFFESEAAANEAANAARNATETRTLSQAVDEYLATIPEKGRATARHRLVAFLKLPDGDRLLRSVTARDAQRLYKDRRETTQPVWTCTCGWKGCKARGTEHTRRRDLVPIADATHRAELALTRRMFDHHVKAGHVKVNPFDGVQAVGRAKRGKPKLRVNPSRVFLNYLMADSSVEATAVMMAFVLGLRRKAVVERRVEDLDDDGWLLWVRDNKTASGDLEIEVPDFLRDRLLALVDGKAPQDPLFVRESGEPASPDWLYWHTIRLCRAAGVPRVTPHGLRGSGATKAVRLGGSLEDVARAVGHADDGATLKAHYLSPGALESARGRKIAQLVQATSEETRPVLRVVNGGAHG